MNFNILVTFFATTHAFAIQYLGWLIPFGILNSEYRWLKWYTLAAYGYMALVYFTLILNNLITRFLAWPQADLYIIIPASIPVWLISIGWLVSRLKRTTPDLQESGRQGTADANVFP